METFYTGTPITADDVLLMNDDDIERMLSQATRSQPLKSRIRAEIKLRDEYSDELMQRVYPALWALGLGADLWTPSVPPPDAVLMTYGSGYGGTAKPWGKHHNWYWKLDSGTHGTRSAKYSMIGSPKTLLYASGGNWWIKCSNGCVLNYRPGDSNSQTPPTSGWKSYGTPVSKYNWNPAPRLVVLST